MNHTITHTRPSRTGRGAFAAVAAVAVLAGCGTTTTDAPDGGQPPTSTRAPAPSYCVDKVDPATGTNLCDPEKVMAAAATALYSYHPSTQTQKGVDIDAAATLLNPSWVQQLGTSYSALAPVTGAQWDRWRLGNQTVTATAAVTPDDRPADTETVARRVVAVSQTVQDPDGLDVEELAPIALYTSVTRANAVAGWSLSSVVVR
ncbi:hypothetical protein [Rhodococcus sp. SORGH_AS_0301]|uniref:hypothetical protein n=1 Tax=Rhodococcus sp. SORGH_AS_0301 TaxID=3041780 RepID=UPI0027862995|nr:hypothetical protein [Rhodococcus sp. SORGH_AS_0301]MDQ1178635.1 hypothetical protein [Rhodococcus sp. SORGH_AS_0301]